MSFSSVCGMRIPARLGCWKSWCLFDPHYLNKCRSLTFGKQLFRDPILQIHLTVQKSGDFDKISFYNSIKDNVPTCFQPAQLGGNFIIVLSDFRMLSDFFTQSE